MTRGVRASVSLTLKMTEAPSGAFQAKGRDEKTGISYQSGLAALFDPGESHDFFSRNTNGDNY